MRHSKTWIQVSIAAALVLLLGGPLFAASAAPAGAWSGTVASVSGDDLALAGVPDHFRLAGSVTELLSGRSLTAKDLAPGSAVTLRIGSREADGRFRIDTAVLQPKNPLTLSGEVTRIADDRMHVEVHGVEIEIDDHTAFSGRGSFGSLRSARDLRAGALLAVTLETTAAGTLRATGIAAASSSNDSGEDEEFKGTVSAITDTAWTIDTKVFAITDQTIFEGSPAVGDFVEVKFHTDATGGFVADRIEKDDDAPGAEVEFRGIVEAIGDSSWTISGRVVAVDASTEIDGTPKVGDSVEVHAQKAADGTLTATRIHKEDDGDNNDDNGDDNGSHGSGGGNDDHSGQGNGGNDDQGASSGHGGPNGGGNSGQGGGDD